MKEKVLPTALSMTFTQASLSLTDTYGLAVRIRYLSKWVSTASFGGLNGSFLGLKINKKVHKCNYFKKYLFIYKVLHTNKYQVYKGYLKPKTASPRTSERYVSLYYITRFYHNSPCVRDPRKTVIVMMMMLVMMMIRMMTTLTILMIMTLVMLEMLVMLGCKVS
jgi:hypothetical protein